MKPLNKKLLKLFLEKAGKILEGEWALIGGTVLPLLNSDFRVTMDIDLIPLSNKEPNSALLDLMKLAESLDLAVETINFSGKYFLEKIPNYRKSLILLHQGPSSTIFRPNATLFILLKISRLSETDFLDCIEFLRFAKKINEPVDRATIEKAMRKQRTKASQAQLERLDDLANHLQLF